MSAAGGINIRQANRAVAVCWCGVLSCKVSFKNKSNLNGCVKYNKGHWIAYAVGIKQVEYYLIVLIS